MPQEPGKEKTTAAEEMQRRAQRVFWEGDRAAWALQQPLTAELATHLPLQPVLDDRLPLVLSDGRRIFFNVHASARLKAPQRRFLQAHLVWHCALGHLRACPMPDLRRWHLACDQEVNAILLLLGFPLPDDAVLFPACIGKSLPEIYAWLEDHPCLSLESSPDRILRELIDPERDLHLPGRIQDPALDPRPPDPGLLAAWEERLRQGLRRHGDSPQLAGPVAALLASRS
ncbi:MAG: DUF2201 family putative metallopeptidase [Ectothiorhodospira sp.]